MAKGWRPLHYLLDDRRAITTTAKAGSTSLARAFPGKAGLTDLECIARGLRIVLIIRNPWDRLRSMYHGFADRLTPAEYVDHVLTHRNPHWSPQVEQHPIYDDAVKLECINDWWPLPGGFPWANARGSVLPTNHRRRDLAKMFYVDWQVWRAAYGDR